MHAYVYFYGAMLRQVSSFCLSICNVEVLAYDAAHTKKLYAYNAIKSTHLVVTESI